MLNANRLVFENVKSSLILVGGIAVYIFIAAASNIINDVFDCEIDKINRPHRPIPSGKISIRAAIPYSAILVILGAGISIPLGFFTPNGLLIPIFGVFFGVIGFLYSWKGKKKGFIGNLMVGVSFPSGIPFGALLITPFMEVPPFLWFFFVTAMFLLVSREIIKGMEDMEGDTQYDIKTIANTRGIRFAAWTSGIFSVTALLTFSIPAFVFSLNIWFKFLMSIGNIFVLVSIIHLIHPILKKNQTIASLYLKISAYIGLLACVLAIF